MSNDNEERVIQKIRKLFALSANAGATGAEAETALRMANALLSKHAIEKHRLHEEDAVFASFCDYPISQAWVKQVVSIISRFYNCRPIFDYNWTPAKSLIIGTSSKRITAIIVIDQLLSQINRDGKGKGMAFKNGAAYGLSEACDEILTKRNAETGNDEVIPGTGLTVIKIDEQEKANTDAFIDKEFSGLTRAKGKSRSMSSEGRSYGKGLNPNARMGGSAQKCLN